MIPTRGGHPRRHQLPPTEASCVPSLRCTSWVLDVSCVESWCWGEYEASNGMYAWIVSILTSKGVELERQRGKEVLRPGILPSQTPARGSSYSKPIAGTSKIAKHFAKMSAGGGKGVTPT